MLCTYSYIFIVKDEWDHFERCRAPVLQILWGGQIERRGRDYLDPHGSRRPCIWGMTRAACFDMILVVTCGEEVLHRPQQCFPQTSGRYSTPLHKEPERTCLLPHCDLDAEPLRLLLINADYPIFSKYLSPSLKKPKTEVANTGTGLGVPNCWLASVLAVSSPMFY